MGAGYASKFYGWTKMVYPLGKTEVEMLAGKVVELGKEYGIPTPVNQTLYRCIRAIEQKRDPLESTIC
jgi:hypothetical protein